MLQTAPDLRAHLVLRDVFGSPFLPLRYINWCGDRPSQMRVVQSDSLSRHVFREAVSRR